MSGASLHPPTPGLISVVIPAYNAQRFLRTALDSVLAQTWPEVEIIVVDDGSTDGTAALLATYGERVRALHQPNGGLASARRTGVAAARGELIALMDADDVCRPERLAVQARVLQRWPEVVLCCSEFSAFDASGTVESRHARHYYAALRQSAHGIRDLLTRMDTLQHSESQPSTVVYHGRAYSALAHGNFVHPPTILFRRSLLAKVGSFDPAAGSMCDWDWIARAARAGEIAFVDHPLLDYRLSPAQMSSPRHRIRASMDTLRVAERICRRDEALYLAELPRFRSDLGFFCADAADASIEHDKRQAARLLWRSMFRFGRFDALTLRVLLKLLVPGWLLLASRQRRLASSP